MGHNVGKAAENAVRKSEKTSRQDRSTEEIINDIRKNIAGRLAITFDDTVVLFNEYTRVVDELTNFSFGKGLPDISIIEAGQQILRESVSEAVLTPRQVLRESEDGV